jgi:hypothetical protein
LAACSSAPAFFWASRYRASTAVTVFDSSQFLGDNHGPGGDIVSARSLVVRSIFCSVRH